MSGAGAAPRFVAQASADVDAFLHRWEALTARLAAAGQAPRSPFQRVAWLASWYRTLGARPGVEPVCVTVTRDAEPVLLLPLVAERRGRLRLLRFADDGVTDYNAPLAVELPAEEAPALWAAVRRSLRGADLLQLDKMLCPTAPRAQPLAGVRPALPCEWFGNEVVLPDDWDAWRHTLDKTVRKEFERTWRVFGREPDASFQRATSMDTALAWFDALEAQQRERMAFAGSNYRLDLPAWRALYLDRLRHGLADGSVVLTALLARGAPVAVLFGICDGSRYIALRIGHAGDAWKHCAPGKLLLERTMHHLHGRGLRCIDFALGDYFHKRVFRVAPVTLVDARAALSIRGLPPVWAWQMRRALKRSRWLVELVRRAGRRRAVPARAVPPASPTPVSEARA